MSKKEKFKQFASSNPQLLKHVESGTKTWQEFFELYDIYGDNKEAWSEYLNPSTDTRDATNPSSIPDLIKNIDLNQIQKHIGTAQKALGFIQDLTVKGTAAGAGLGAAASAVTKGPKTPRPINKLFED